MTDHCDECAPEFDCWNNPLRCRKLPTRPAYKLSPEEWWVEHAGMLAVLMAKGNVRLLRVELTPRGTYEFEIDPVP